MIRALLPLLCLTGCLAAPEAVEIAAPVSVTVNQACPDCKAQGLCTWTPERGCIAATDADCRQSLACWSESKCAAEDGVCVSSWASRVGRSLRAFVGGDR